MLPEKSNHPPPSTSALPTPLPPTAPCPEPRSFPRISTATSCLLATCIQCHQLQRTPLLRLRSQMPAEWQEEDVQDEKCMWWRAMKEMWKETPAWARRCFVPAMPSAESRATARTGRLLLLAKRNKFFFPSLRTLRYCIAKLNLKLSHMLPKTVVKKWI